MPSIETKGCRVGPSLPAASLRTLATPARAKPNRAPPWGTTIRFDIAAVNHRSSRSSLYEPDNRRSARPPPLRHRDHSAEMPGGSTTTCVKSRDGRQVLVYSQMARRHGYRTLSPDPG